MLFVLLYPNKSKKQYPTAALLNIKKLKPEILTISTVEFAQITAAHTHTQRIEDSRDIYSLEAPRRVRDDIRARSRPFAFVNIQFL